MQESTEWLTRYILTQPKPIECRCYRERMNKNTLYAGVFVLAVLALTARIWITLFL